MQPSRPDDIRPAHLALALAASALVFVLAHFWGLSGPMVVNDDVRQQVFWMQQWQDPGLYPPDLLGDYARAYVPWGVKAAYRAAAPVVNPLYFSKILPGVLFMFTAGCLFFIGRRLAGPRGAWIAVCLLWLLPFFLDRMSGGLSRGFATPLLAWFLAAWLWRRPGQMSLGLLLQALCVPYILPVCAGASLLAWAASLPGWAAPPVFPARWWHWGCLALAAGLAAWFNQGLAQSGFGPLVSAADMAGRQEFGSLGRYPIVPTPSIFYELVRPWALIGPFKELGPAGGAVALGLPAAAALYGLIRLDWPRTLPGLAPLGLLLAASLAMYIAARLLLLKLFIPDRYLIYSLNLAYLVILTLGLGAALGRRPVAAGLAALLVSLCLAAGAGRLHGLRLYDYSDFGPLCREVSLTPPGALIAGHPETMDNVLTFARRNVLASYELSHPWSKGYWQRLEPRLRALFTAYYAADPAAIRRLAAEYGVTHLVVDRRHFSPEFLAGHPFFSPFDQFIRRAAAHPGPFAALTGEGFPRTEVDAHRFILDLREAVKGSPPAGR